jgi:hypothetical protein
MSSPSPLLTRGFLVGVLILSTAYGASALTVNRTNKLIDGVYVPVLVVKVGGESHIHQIGEDGLTRSILFNRKRALEWARDRYGAEIVDVTEDSGSDGGGYSYDGDDGAYT